MNPNYPAGVCGVSIGSQGGDAWVKVVTASGQVWQTHGDVNGTSFVWDEPWIQNATPRPAVLRSAGPETAAGAAPRH
ncbi:hypothetical protein ACIRBY_02740 [Streptomyces sp. NPDC096136]|uniref:hypothetical protein n=1 Tax=Streptomyces sp. NPDC096136 TaxID=3366076 RepID=UPI00382C07B9